MARKRAGRRGPRLGKYSDEQLQTELRRRRESRLKELKEERARLDSEIAQISSAMGVAKPKTTRRRRMAKSTAEAPVRKRASQAELRALAERVRKVLGAHPKGIGMAELRKSVRAKVPTLRLALKKLIAQKKAKRTGERRFTKYYPL